MRGEETVAAVRKKGKVGWWIGLTLLVIVACGQMVTTWKMVVVVYVLYLLLLVAISVVRYFTRPRPKRWFVPGTISLVAVSAGTVLGLLSSGPSDPLYTAIPPVRYDDASLAAILQDLCRQLEVQGSRARFVLRGKELQDKTVTFRTQRKMRLKQVLEELTDEVGCYFRYGTCGTGGGLLGPIIVYREKEKADKDTELWIDADTVAELGGEEDNRFQDEGEKEGNE